MKAQLLSVFLLACAVGFSAARGGLFNRFTPELLSNLGFGGAGNRWMSFAQDGPPSRHNAEDLLDNLLTATAEEEDREEDCAGKRCTANEHCCTGTVCVDTDGLYGACMPVFGKKQGEECQRDNDCGSGLICQTGMEVPTCESPVASKKQYSEECNMSAECDISKGLCCQLQRRHRQAPKKVCLYFKDPLMCVGPVNPDQIKEVVQHTAGEKRITTNSRAFKHLR